MILSIKKLFMNKGLILVITALVIGGAISFTLNARKPSQVLSPSDNSSFRILAQGSGIAARDLSSRYQRSKPITLNSQGEIDDIATILRDNGTQRTDLESVKPDFSKNSVIFMTRSKGASDTWKVDKAIIKGKKASIQTLYISQGKGCIGLPSEGTSYFLLALPPGISDITEDLQEVDGEACSRE